MSMSMGNALSLDAALDIGEIVGYDSLIEDDLDRLTSVTDEYTSVRQDLRELDTYTIDPPGAKDYDDALSVHRRFDDDEVVGYTAYVHVPDVSLYLKEDTLLDKVSRRKGRTMYYRRRADHMLPPSLAEELSLSAGTDKLANTIEFTFSADGALTGSSVYRSIIRPDKNLSYGEAAAYTRQGPGRLSSQERDAVQRMQEKSFLPDTPQLDLETADDLSLLHYLAILLADDRHDTLLHDAPPAHMTVEEFMVAANRECAKELDGPAIYRAHGVPEENDRVNVPAAADYGWAYYTPVSLRHDDLGFDRYAPFTAPLRRYADIVNWRQLHGESSWGRRELTRLADQLTAQPPEP